MHFASSSYRLPVCAMAAAVALFAEASHTVRADVPEGFVALFNGQDLTGWKGLVADPKKRAEMSAEELATAQAKADERMREHWKVIDGVIEFDGKGDSLCTLNEYGDFELYVDWKILEGGDSGIYIRGCPQIQIWDSEYKEYHQMGADKGSGAPWNNQKNLRFPLTLADNPAGEWNSFFIRMIGERLTVQLNGQLVVDNVVMENYWERDKPIYARGQIELQNHGNKLWFRNIYLRKISSEDANITLSAQDTDGFNSIFNGQDLTGWTGAVENYEVKNGSIVCKSGKGGNLLTEQEYSDFVARMEFKLPPAGNNGLAIRYSGTGSPHLDGMCELQVLDSESPKYTNLDKRQYHGSAYGLVAAHRGYLRPVGEWNFQQVTVVGSTIKVELNGFTILDTDLSQVKETMKNEPHPNINRKKGYFGFAGHSDPVAFRNIAIRELSSGENVVPISPKNEPIKLFNGKNLDGFYTWIQGDGYDDPRQVFTIQDGLLRISGDGYGGLITKQTYRDYHLIIEFKWGETTWGNRKNAARDSGILVHCHGPDGSLGPWMASVEAQIIEGGVGDILVLSGKDPDTGDPIKTTLTVETTRDRDGERVWKKDGKRETLNGGRINWWGRDVDWADKVGFRGREDVESPFGEWTRMDVICDGGHIVCHVNGQMVNEGFDSQPDFGKIFVQTEQAEMFVRRYELWPLGTAPTE